MASNYPTSLDNFTNPTSNDSLNSPSHSLQHANINDAVEAIEAKLGIGVSTAGSATSGQVLTAGTGGTTTWTTPAATNNAWISYTPTLTNITLGNGTITAAYNLIGKNLFIRFRFAGGSTSSLGTGPKFSIPSGLTITNNQTYLGGRAFFEDSGIGTYQGFLYVDTTTSLMFFVNTVSGSLIRDTTVTSTTPFTFGNTDNLWAMAILEVD